MDYIVVGALLICGLFLLQTARWLFSDHSALGGAAAVVLGVILLGATVVYVAPALMDTEKGKLAEQVAKLKTESASLKAEKSTLEGDIKRHVSAQDAAAARFADLERRRVSELDGLASGVEELRVRMTSSQAGLMVDRPYMPETADKADRLRAEVRALSDFRVRQAVAAVAQPVQPETPRELTVLKDKMSARLSTPNYDVEVYPDKEMVRGRPGRYYVVDLKNATSGVRYFFAGGKYTLGLGNPEFRASLNTFVGDILSKFEGKVRYDLYVRGNADEKPYQGPFEPGYEFRTIKYVRSLGNDKYGLDTSERTIGGYVRNEDLPDMRAAFMQRVIAEAYPLKAPTILQGIVTAKTDDKDRNAELLLYVDW